MKLILIRHAIAVDRETAGISDDLRPLTEEGSARFQKTARGISRLVTADLLLTSPLVRARQTAQILLPHWTTAPMKESEALGSGSRSQFEGELASISNSRVVAAVGHEPYLSEWTAEWLGARPGANFAFKKGGVACIDFKNSVKAGAGRLVFFLAPKAIKSLS